METTTQAGAFKIDAPETSSILESLGVNQERKDAICAIIFDSMQENSGVKSTTGIIKKIAEAAQTPGELAFGAFALGQLSSGAELLELLSDKKAFHEFLDDKIRHN